MVGLPERIPGARVSSRVALIRVNQLFNTDETQTDRATLRSQSGAQLPRRDGRVGSPAGIASRDYQPARRPQATPIHCINPEGPITISNSSFSSEVDHRVKFPLNYMGAENSPTYAGLVGRVEAAEAGQELRVELRAGGRLLSEQANADYYSHDASEAGNCISGVVEVNGDSPEYEASFGLGEIQVKLKNISNLISKKI